VRPKKEKRGAQNGRTMAKSGRHKGLHKCSYLAKLSAQCVGARRPNDGLLNVVNLFWPGTYSNFKFHPGAGSSRPVPVMTRPKNKARAEFEMSKCLDARLPGCRNALPVDPRASWHLPLLCTLFKYLPSFTIFMTAKNITTPTYPKGLRLSGERESRPKRGHLTLDYGLWNMARRP